MLTSREERKYTKMREDMVYRQLESRGITDENVLNAMRTVPRHLFVPEAFMDRAYDDTPLPIGDQQTISQPFMVAEMTQALTLDPDDTVLEIGTGSGYQAAVLSELVFRVYTIERKHALYMRTRKLFDDQRYYNIVTRFTDGTGGWKDAAPFDAIIVTAGGPEIPQALLNQLADGGRLIIPVGDQHSQELIRVTKTNDGFTHDNLGKCRFVKLIGEFGWKD